tara:strand:+ start:229 stop:861 length:633 start_codon:yes stop_codon:yes gene_type:complete
MELKAINPCNLGWLQVKLNDNELKHLWDMCKTPTEDNYKDKLAGHNYKSQLIDDKDDWFWNNVLSDLCNQYALNFENIGNNIPNNQNHPYYLNSMWVNYQKENEFNPRHNHTHALYSFVVWMKIPTEYSEQRKLPIAESTVNSISNFSFDYVDILGQSSTFIYEMSKEAEGTLLFFPANLNHTVYPFYNCKEDRISISGNIGINTKKLFN